MQSTVAGKTLTGATAPLFSAMPAHATNPAFTVPRGAPAGRGARH